MGIRDYLFVSLALITAVPILVFGFYETRRWRRVQEEQADQQHGFAAHAVVDQLSTLLVANERAIELVADRVLELNTLDPARLQPLLDSTRRRHPTITIFVANAALTSVAASPAWLDGKPAAGHNYADREYIRAGLANRRLMLSGIEIGKITGTPNLHAAMAMWRPDGTLLGVVAAALDLATIQEVARRSASAIPGLELIVADSRGRVVIHPDRRKELSMADLGAMKLFAPVAGNTPQIRTGTDDSGVQVRAAVATMHDLGREWTVAVFQPQSDLETEARATARALVGGGLSIVLISLLLSAMIASWLAAPIVRLAAFAGRPDDGAQLPSARRSDPREVVELLEATGSMLHRINAHTVQLEAKVEERTAALREVHGKLALAERLTALGTLVAGMAHEMNNPLAIVISNLDYIRGRLQKQAGSDERFADDLGALDDALDGANRALVLVQDLRATSQGDERGKDPISVHTVVEAALRLSAEHVQNRARLTVTHEEAPKVQARESRLVQIVTNLIVNAAQALPEDTPARNLIEVRSFFKNGRVSVAVRDNGCGIDPASMRRIFEPFYTTKGVGVGTGLGLFICHRIITSLGGELLVDSQPGRGSTFTMCIPPATQAGTLPTPDSSVERNIGTAGLHQD
jgi:two-component system NtrC family sensor kinase